ncbi:protein kinase [Streptomyces sp. NPDC058877]|uniref:serine/threonine-protein kinase n=1 Tax=unclassified Streptomyces TaxID=2593676 RepID=UPI003691B5BE
MLEALPPELPPRLLGPYRLLARIGAGGMGEVHLACRADAPTADPHRMVAVKTVREELEVDADFRTRFRREIVAARAVDGPGVARLVDADADAPSPWLATEYVPGPSLAEAVTRSGALPVETVRALGTALAGALAGVHATKVLHRDLKPANVLLAATGPKLIDFGIAQPFEATALTSTGLVVGSPGFMSPEHLVGSRAVVPTSDVFCLGSVLAFAASGRGPFHDDEMAAVVYRISRAEAELDGVPEELRPVVERCLRLDPTERPSAGEVAELLGKDVRPGAFPWPGGVLSLLASYGEAARKVGGAAASGAGVADLPTLGPVVPYSPTAMGVRSVPPAAPAGRRRRPWGAITAGAVAAALLAAGGVVLLNRTDAQGTGAAGGGTGPSGSTTPSGTTPGTALSEVVLPYGGEGHGRDYGGAGTDLDHRPAGWSPWTARVGQGVGSCALSPKVLVCPGNGGAVTGLSAADGKEVWKVAGRGDGLRSGPQYPAVIGDAVYVTGPDGIVSYGVADGAERGRIAGPGGDWAVKGTDLRDGVLYSTYVNLRDERTGLVTAVRLSDGAELWRKALDALPEQPVAAAGRVLVPLGVVPVALDSRTGGEVARGTDDCQRITVHVKSSSVLCTGPSDGSVTVLDAATLKRKRSFGTAVTAGPAVNADGLVAVASGPVISAYDLMSGTLRWSISRNLTGAAPREVYFAGDRVLAVAQAEAVSVAAAGPASENDYERFQAKLPEDFEPRASGESLAAGGAMFVSLPDGLVLSGYLP